MTRLLVSVRNAEEAATALVSGADLIDVKEPANGSLGAAPAQVVEQVVAAVGGKLPVSMALGELHDLSHPGSITLPLGVEFAKLGMAKCLSLPNWQSRWASLVETFPSSTRPVGVIYADWEAVGAPVPEQVLVQSVRLNCAAVLIDTCTKGSKNLLDYWSLDQLTRWIHYIRDHGMLVVVGGSLTLERIACVAELGPDYVALRGAVCVGGRGGRLVGERVREAARRVATAN